ncbi:MAG: FAD-binding oxidoreductase [Salaquimonas sp.]
MSKPLDPQLIQRFIDLVGEKNALTSADDLTHYTHENRDIFVGKTPLVLKPQSTDAVAQIIRLANETKTAIVPQGGHTGHAAGGVPDDSGEQIVLSMERMNRIRDIDLEGNTAIVEAGVILKSIQLMADENERLFPLTLASEGSCMIGGNISTNAGGTAVLSYGNTRDMILGLEVVTATGEIWNGLRRLKKDNTGYDLRDLFIGAEGTLGIITAAVIKLFPKPVGRVAAFAGMKTPEAALELFQIAGNAAGKSLTGFEFMPQLGIETVQKFAHSIKSPLQCKHQWYVLMEISSGRSQVDATELAEEILGKAVDTGAIEDAVVSQNESQRDAFWTIRETMPSSQKLLGGSIKNDISVPVHQVPAFLKQADAAVTGFMAGARLFSFGHMGDGNIHYNISQPENLSTEEFLAEREALNAVVNKVVLLLNGSISAEHGIGKLKRQLLTETKSSVEMQMMRAIKQALDPNGIMNPGKVVQV